MEVMARVDSLETEQKQDKKEIKILTSEARGRLAKKRKRRS